jgi:hypothetical protein
VSPAARIETHGRVFFRGLACPNPREDTVAEMVALSWVWFLRLAAQGKDPLAFPTMLASYAAKAVGCGRRACRREGARQGCHVAVGPTSAPLLC